MIFIPNNSMSAINSSIVIQMAVTILLLFGRKLTRRKNFIPKYILLNILCYLYSININYVYLNIYFGLFIYTSIFATQIVVVKLCYKDSLYTVLFVVAAAYNTEHIVSMVYSLISFVDISTLNFGYGGEWSLGIFVIYAPLCLIVDFLIYIIMVKPMNFSRDLIFKSKSIIILVFTSVFVDVIINLYLIFYVYNSLPANSNNILFIIYIMNILCGTLVLSIQFGMFNISENRRKLEVTSELWKQAQLRYKQSKESIDAINLKCHDLKHRITGMKKTDNFDDIIQDIDIYDSNIETNNEALNVLLSEKSSHCKKNDIQFTCIADGMQLNFINTIDTYVLFGNIMDNAINSVINLRKDYEKNIRLDIRKEQNFTIINSENNYSGKIHFKDNLPITSHANKNNHGYGMVSIKNIVEKYDGSITIHINDGIFKLNILIPDIDD